MMSIVSLMLLASIDRVTVLADRAEVVRVVPARCTAGRAEITMSGLPVSLDERTVQVSASGGAKVLGTTLRTIGAELPAARKGLEEARNEARRRLQANRDAARSHQEEIAQVAAYQRFVDPILREDMRGAKPSPEAWKRTLDGLDARALAASARVIELEPERRAIERELAAIEAKLGHLAATPAVESKSVTVAIDCGGEIEPKVSLGYVVPGASWHPEYEIRFVPDRDAKTGRGRVEIVVAAVVAQSTGEDWTQASITLSTAKPRLGAEVPQPAPIVVDGSESHQGNVLVQGVEDRSSLSGSTTPGGRAAPTRVGLDDGGRAFTLSFPGRATITSDGRSYWLPVDEVTGPAESRLVTVPKLSPHVYQTLAFESPARYPLLAGRARMHRGGSFVGEASLAHTAPGAPVELSLGIDGELRVERKDVSLVDRSPGFLSKTKKLERHLRFVVINEAAAAQKIELRENIPVSKDEKLEVELDGKRTTPGAKHDVERGFLVWTLDVAAGKSRTVDLAYVVKLPESWRVQ